MKPKATIEHYKRSHFFMAIALCFLILSSGCTRFSKHKVGETPDLSQPRQSLYSAPVTRLNSGFMNVLSGLLEPVNQMREEVKRTNPIRGFIPGAMNGVAWLMVREAVGIFEILTFYLPLEPHLDPINIEWLTA